MNDLQALIAKLGRDIRNDAEMVRFHREESIRPTLPDHLRKYNAELAAIYQELLESKMRLLNTIKK